MQRSWWFGISVVLMIFLGLFGIMIFWVKHSAQSPSRRGSFFVTDYPISPHAKDVWIKDDKNRFLRFPTNEGSNAFESYDLDRDPSELISISPEYVVGNFQTEVGRPILVAGKLNPNGSIHFDSEPKLELISYNYQNFISAFDECLFCCLVEDYWPGDGGSREIISIQLNLANELPKFEVRSRLEFADTFGPCFLYQATRKNTLVYIDRMKKYGEKAVRGRLAVVNVSKDGTLTYKSIEPFESRFNIVDTSFWIDLTEDGRWIATTETTDEPNERGEYICSVVLSEIGDGRVVNRYEKRFNFKPLRAYKDLYPISIPIRFDSDGSCIFATPVGFGEFDFIEQGNPPELSKLKFNQYLTPLGALRDDGIACFSGIVKRSGSWFAVRQVDIVQGERKMLRGADSFIKMK